MNFVQNSVQDFGGLTELMNPLAHMKPYIRISPFSGGAFEDLLSSQKSSDKNISAMLPEFWLDHAVQMDFFRSGRSALKQALLASGLTRNDSVIIITTTGGDYVSSCVTKSIEEVCLWSRELEKNTRAVLLIHEFGFPCPLPDGLRDRGLTIIEDCAYAIGTRVESGSVGRIGDFAIYSLPKYYPIPYGGLLVSRAEIEPNLNSKDISIDAAGLIEKCLICADSKYVEWNQQRRSNWRYFAFQMELKGMREYFQLGETVVPGAFVVNLPKSVDGASIKDKCNKAGIESTEYYGQNGFYFPVHQYLSSFDKEYICYHFTQGLDA